MNAGSDDVDKLQKDAGRAERDHGERPAVGSSNLIPTTIPNPSTFGHEREMI